MKGSYGRLNEFKIESTRTEIASELLAEQHFDVGLIINHKN